MDERPLFRHQRHAGAQPVRGRGPDPQVELVRGAELQVPLYWHQVRLKIPMLERLTQDVLAAAREGLEP